MSSKFGAPPALSQHMPIEEIGAGEFLILITEDTQLQASSEGVICDLEWGKRHRFPTIPVTQLNFPVSEHI